MLCVPRIGKIRKTTKENVAKGPKIGSHKVVWRVQLFGKQRSSLPQLPSTTTRHVGSLGWYVFQKIPGQFDTLLFWVGLLDPSSVLFSSPNEDREC